MVKVCSHNLVLLVLIETGLELGSIIYINMHLFILYVLLILIVYNG